jgi:hypothetical protein
MREIDSMKTQLDQIEKLATMMQERLDTLSAELQNFRDTFPHGGITLDRLRIVGKGAEGDIDMPLLEAMARGIIYEADLNDIMVANREGGSEFFRMHEVAIVIDGATEKRVAA